MDWKICAIILLYSLFIRSIHCQCQPNNESSPLQFSQSMLKSVPGTVNNFKKINCCVTGYIFLSWTFNEFLIKNEENRYFMDKNQTLVISSVKYEEAGHYCCEAVSKAKQKIKGCTQLIIFNKPEDGTFQIASVSAKTEYFEHEAANLSCVLSTTYSNLRLLVTWKMNDSKICSWRSDAKYSQCKSVSTAVSCCNKIEKGTENTHPENKYESYLNFSIVRVNHTGNYSCSFEEVGVREQKVHLFLFTVIPRPMFATIYFISSSCVVFVSILLSALIWGFYYDIRLAIINNEESKKITIAYNDNSTWELKLAMWLSEIFDNHNIKTYIYDRDKTFGKTVLEEWSDIIQNSSTVLFICTPLSITNSNFVNCLKLSYKNMCQRLFVFYPSRKKVLHSPGIIDKSLEDAVQSEKNFWTWKTVYKSSPFYRRRFVKWLIFTVRIQRKQNPNERVE